MSQFYTRPVTMLPGGIPFTDPRTPTKRFAGMEVSTEDEQVGRIIEWRRKNPAVYPPSEPQWLDFAKVREELRKYQMNRLGNSKQFFVNGTNRSIGMVIKVSGPSKACECGATDASPVYCKTCSSARLVGYKCNNCGKHRGL